MSLSAPATRRLLGPVRQFGYVVADAEAAAQRWVGLGIGPWRVLHGLTFDYCEYRGSNVEVEVSIAASYSGGIEIELIAPIAGQRSMYTDFLATGAGAQHVCFYPSDYEAASTHLLSVGFDIVLKGAIAGTDFAYFEDASGHVFEITDLPPDRILSRQHKADNAQAWEGDSPLRITTIDAAAT